MHKDIFRNGDVISGAVLAALGAYIIVESSAWGYRGEDGPGPAFFPIWYGIAMIALSLALIVTTAVRRPETERFDWPAIGRGLLTWLAFAASAALMSWLGFFVSFALLTFFMVTVVFREPLTRAAVVAVCAAAGFYLVFPLALGVQLPIGLFGF